VKPQLKLPKHVVFSSFSVFGEAQALQEGTLVFFPMGWCHILLQLHVVCNQSDKLTSKYSYPSTRINPWPLAPPAIGGDTV
jgi:hypothetical protein